MIILIGNGSSFLTSSIILLSFYPLYMYRNACSRLEILYTCKGWIGRSFFAITKPRIVSNTSCMSHGRSSSIEVISIALKVTFLANRNIGRF